MAKTPKIIKYVAKRPTQSKRAKEIEELEKRLNDPNDPYRATHQGDGK